MKERIRELMVLNLLAKCQMAKFNDNSLFPEEATVTGIEPVNIGSCPVFINEITFKSIVNIVFDNLGLELCEENSKVYDELMDYFDDLLSYEPEVETLNDVYEYIDSILPEFLKKYNFWAYQI